MEFDFWEDKRTKKQYGKNKPKRGSTFSTSTFGTRNSTITYGRSNDTFIRKSSLYESHRPPPLNTRNLNISEDEIQDTTPTNKRKRNLKEGELELSKDSVKYRSCDEENSIDSIFSPVVIAKSPDLPSRKFSFDEKDIK